jgi:hypothetical protein
MLLRFFPALRSVKNLMTGLSALLPDYFAVGTVADFGNRGMSARLRKTKSAGRRRGASVYRNLCLLHRGNGGIDANVPPQGRTKVRTGGGFHKLSGKSGGGGAAGNLAQAQPVGPCLGARHL